MIDPLDLQQLFVPEGGVPGEFLDTPGSRESGSRKVKACSQGPT